MLETQLEAAVTELLVILLTGIKLAGDGTGGCHLTADSSWPTAPTLVGS